MLEIYSFPLVGEAFDPVCKGPPWNLGISNQGTFHWRISSYPDFIQNYFLLKCMLNFFYDRDKCRKQGFLRGDIHTSCIPMVLFDHFENKSNTFLSLFPSISLSLSLSPL